MQRCRKGAGIAVFPTDRVLDLPYLDTNESILKRKCQRMIMHNKVTIDFYELGLRILHHHCSGLQRSTHGHVARFLASMSTRGASEAAGLSGLDLRSELALCVRSGHLRRALGCLAALAAGASERAALAAFPRWHAAGADAAGGTLLCSCRTQSVPKREGKMLLPKSRVQRGAKFLSLHPNKVGEPFDLSARNRILHML